MSFGIGVTNKKVTSSISKKKKKRAFNNAEAVLYEGYNFKSKLEKYTYLKLKEHNIKAEYESTTFTLIEPFEYNGKKLRAMTYTPDFVGNNFIIECKGFPNMAFPLRWKMFMYSLHKKNIYYDLYLPHNHKEVDEVIKTIKEKNDRK